MFNRKVCGFKSATAHTLDRYAILKTKTGQINIMRNDQSDKVILRLTINTLTKKTVESYFKNTFL